MADDTNEVDEPHVTVLAQWSLAAIAVISVFCAIGHAIWPERIDEKVAMFLAVAVVTLVIPQVTKFKGFGIEFEKEVKRLRRNVENVQEAVGQLEKSVGPGRKNAVAPAPSAPRQLFAGTGEAPIDPDDPNKNQFGGKAEANGRRLSATIEPVAGKKSPRCRVKITISSTDPSRPLIGKANLYLHPTFGRWSTYDVEAKGGVVEDDFVSYGAFTIGAEVDDGQTRLELDLMNVPGGTEAFYEA